MESLRDPKLLRCSSYINGSWTEKSAENAKNTLEVINPATGKRLGTLAAISGPDDVNKAIDAAHSTFNGKDKSLAWKCTTGEQRSKILMELARLHEEHMEDLAKLITLEGGKPLTEAKGEVKYSMGYFQWFAEEAKRIDGDVLMPPQNGRKLLVSYQPVGVCGLITPWNFPSAMMARKIGAAIAAGCTVVIKPASSTPYSCLAFVELFARAAAKFPDIPTDGVVNAIITTSSKDFSKALLDSDLVRKISFTGSTAVGKSLAEGSANTLKKVSLELGGNAPFIVFDDADIDKAVEGASFAKFRNAGQTCICLNRLFVHEAIYDKFVEKLVEKVKKEKVGDGLEDGVTCGPLISKEAVDQCKEYVEDAVKNGAKVLLGGNIMQRDGFFFEPTIMDNVSDKCKMVTSEIFGPIIGLMKFKTEEEVIKMANSTEYGLASYFFANDVSRIMRVNDALQFGMVGVNTPAITLPSIPFGGVKMSGYGREGSKYGVHEYMNMKYMCLAYKDEA